MERCIGGTLLVPSADAAVGSITSNRHHSRLIPCSLPLISRTSLTCKLVQRVPLQRDDVFRRDLVLCPLQFGKFPLYSDTEKESSRKKSHKLVCMPSQATSSAAPMEVEEKETKKQENVRGSILDTIGNTPMVYLNHVSSRCCARIACKLEFMQPCRSVKDRIALAMVEDAERKGILIPGQSTIVEPTSGNTGVGLAFVCASKGYHLVLTMPEDQSIERRILVRALGAQVHLTPKRLAMTGSIRKAAELVRSIPGAVSLDQFSNPANPLCHYQTTGPEIWHDTKGQVDILVAGVGTGGTITGCGEFLKEHNPRVLVVAVEPAESAVISGGRPGFHQIQGIGAGFIPRVLNIDILDEVFKVYSRDSIDMARRLQREEGLMVGISSGAAAYAAVKIASRPENKGKLVVCVLPSFGERYISTPLFQSEWRADIVEEQSHPPDWQHLSREGAEATGP